MIYKAKLIKLNNPSKYMFNVLSVKANKKYGYFEITTKIYHHQIITTKRFNEVDFIELYENESWGNDKPIKVVNQE